MYNSGLFGGIGPWGLATGLKEKSVMKKFLAVWFLAAGAVCAEDFTWKRGVECGRVNDAANYIMDNGSGASGPAAERAPGAGDTVHLAYLNGATTTLMLPEGDSLISRYSSFLKQDAEIVFDGADVAHTMAGSAEFPRSRSAMGFSSGGNRYYFGVKVGAGAEDLLTWSNALVRLARTGSGFGAEVKFERGTFDFCNTGSTVAFGECNTAEAPNNDFAAEFKGVDVKFQNAEFYLRSKRNRVEFDGGRYEAAGNFKMRSSDSTAEGAETARVEFKNGAKVAVDGSFEAWAKDGYPVEATVSGGAEVASRATSGIMMNLWGSTNLNFTVGTDGRVALAAGGTMRVNGRLAVTGENARVDGVAGKAGGNASIQLGIGANSISVMEVGNGGKVGCGEAPCAVMAGHSHGTNIVRVLAGGEIRADGGVSLGGNHNGTAVSNVVEVHEGGKLTAAKINALWAAPSESYNGVCNCAVVQWGGEIDTWGTVEMGGAASDTERSRCRLELNGGVMRATEVCAKNTEKSGKSGKGSFGANGGRLEAKGAKEKFVWGFDAAELGEKGLTIDTKGFEVGLDQAFKNAEGARGVLRKAGAGALKLNAETADGAAFARMVAGEGVLKIGADAAKFDPEVEAEGGATVDFAGVRAGGIRVGGLRLGSGGKAATVRVELSRPVRVGSFAAEKADLEMSGEHGAGTHCIFRVENAGAETAADWGKVRLTAGRKEGLCYNLEAAVEADGTMALNVVASAAAEPGNAVAWAGGGEHTDWGDAAAWSGERQGAQDAATFGGTAGAERTVGVSGTETVGKVAFAAGGGDHTIIGDGRLNFADTGYAEVKAEGGVQRFDVEAGFTGMLKVDVAEGATVGFERGVVGGGLEKRGLGTLELNGAGDFTLGIEVREGKLKAAGGESIRNTTGNGGTLTLGDGTLSVGGEAGGETVRTGYGLKVETAVESGVAVARIGGDATFSGLAAGGRGNLVKTGKGRMTVEIGEGAMTLGSGVDMQYDGACEALDGDGESGLPTKGYAGLTVAEGELTFRGVGSGAVSDANMHLALPSGFKVGGGSDGALGASAGLVFDHVKANATRSQAKNFLMTGAAEGKLPAAAREAYLYVTNKAEFLSGTYFWVGYGAAAGTAATRPRVVVADGAMMTGSHDLMLSGGPACDARWEVRGKGLVAAKGSIRAYGGVEMTVDNSRVAGLANDARKVPTFEINKDARGGVTFRNGAQFHCEKLKATAALEGDARFTLAFDDATWDLAGADITHRTNRNSTAKFERGGSFRVEARAGGLRLDCGLDGNGNATTLAWHQPVEGEGGIVKTGAGRLAVKRAADLAGEMADARTLRNAGRNVALEGVMEIEAGAADGAWIAPAEGAVVELGDGEHAGMRVSGPGVFAGGTLKNATIEMAAGEGGEFPAAPGLRGVEIAGVMQVDLGCGSGEPFDRGLLAGGGVKVLSAAGDDAIGAGALGALKVVNTGINSAKGTFELRDGGRSVYLTGVSISGMTLIIR